MELTGAALAMAQAMSGLSHHWEHTSWGSVPSLCWMPAQTQACATLSHLCCSMCCLCDGGGVWGQEKSQWWDRFRAGTVKNSLTLGALLAACASVAEITSTTDWGESWEVTVSSLLFLSSACHCLLSFLLVGEDHGVVNQLPLTGLSGELTAQVGSGMQCCQCCLQG